MPAREGPHLTDAQPSDGAWAHGRLAKLCRLAKLPTGLLRRLADGGAWPTPSRPTADWPMAAPWPTPKFDGRLADGGAWPDAQLPDGRLADGGAFADAQLPDGRLADGGA